LLVKPVSAKWYMSADEVAKLQAASSANAVMAGSFGIGKGGLDWQAAVFWSFVGIHAQIRSGPVPLNQYRIAASLCS
jgi:hypothetical protein